MRASALRVQDGGGPGDGTRALRRGRAGLQPAGPRTAPGGSGTEDRAGGERALEGGARGRRNREQGQVRPAGTASLSLTPRHQPWTLDRPLRRVWDTLSSGGRLGATCAEGGGSGRLTTVRPDCKRIQRCANQMVNVRIKHN